MIHFEDAQRRFIDLPKSIFILVPDKKPNVFSSSKKKYIYQLLKLWSYALTEESKVKYETELTLLTALAWKDYKAYNQHAITEIMKM